MTTFKKGDKGFTKGGYPYEVVADSNDDHVMLARSEANGETRQWGYREDGTVNLPAELKALFSALTGDDVEDFDLLPPTPADAAA